VSVHPGINDMKQLRLRVSVLAAASALLVNSGYIQAQIASQEDPARQRKGEVLRTQTQEGSLGGPKTNRPELPESMSEVMRERLLQFEQKREAYLAQQLELLHQLHKASDSDRAQLREQLREQRQAWLEEAKKIREQARARVQEMKRELVNHSEVIEAAREQVREQVQEQVREKVRERRGTD
jgi:vacuolar-type H+-ATPase subunit H